MHSTRRSLLGNRPILEQEKSALAAHREVEIPISIDICDADLDAAPSAAAVINHVLHPVDGVEEGSSNRSYQ